MRSTLPKVLHTVGSRTLLDRAIDVCEALGCSRIIVVAGAHSPAVAAHSHKAPWVRICPPFRILRLALATPSDRPRPPFQTLKGTSLFTYADTPLLDQPAVAPLFELRRQGSDVAVLGFEAKEPGHYGRLIESSEGDLLKIIEAKDAEVDELKVTACNSGVLAAPAALLFSLLAEVD